MVLKTTNFPIDKFILGIFLLDKLTDKLMARKLPDSPINLSFWANVSQAHSQVIENSQVIPSQEAVNLFLQIFGTTDDKAIGLNSGEEKWEL